MPTILLKSRAFTHMGRIRTCQGFPDFCSSDGTGELDDSEATGAVIEIAQGHMFVDELRTFGGHLFFSHVGNPGCPEDHEFSKLVIRFGTAQQFVRIILGFDSSTTGPMLVNFFEQQNSPGATLPLETIRLDFDNFPPVVFNKSAQVFKKSGSRVTSSKYYPRNRIL